uniref:Uncharacterized protein n=1 Tax=Nothoprocta perdicaria TaxID=30464 RepID=A0A8C6YR59_NOTPE
PLFCGFKGKLCKEDDFQNHFDTRVLRGRRLGSEQFSSKSHGKESSPSAEISKITTSPSATSKVPETCRVKRRLHQLHHAVLSIAQCKALFL